MVVCKQGVPGFATMVVSVPSQPQLPPTVVEAPSVATFVQVRGHSMPQQRVC